MKTKNRIRLLALLASFAMSVVIFSGCGDDDTGDPNADPGLISVNTEKECESIPNFTGGDVYAYRLDSTLNQPSLEVGGHPFSGAGDFTADFIATVGNILDGDYPIDHTANKYADLIYSPNEIPGEEYISIQPQPGTIKLENLEYAFNSSTVDKCKVSFVDIKMAYNGDTICVTGHITLHNGT